MRPAHALKGQAVNSPVPSRHILVLLVYRNAYSTDPDDDIALRVLRTMTRLHGECLILGDLLFLLVASVHFMFAHQQQRRALLASVLLN